MAVCKNQPHSVPYLPVGEESSTSQTPALKIKMFVLLVCVRQTEACCVPSAVPACLCWP